jgi:hypothetical protein
MSWIELRDALRRAVVPLLSVLLGLMFLGIASRIYSGDMPPDSRQAFLTVTWAFLGVVIVLYGLVVHAAGANVLDIPRKLYRELKAFFISPVFFIALGCVFLYAAFALLDRAHSAFVFLLAILGVAIVLYGTGTQAAGTGKAGEEKIGATMNVAIAGGAGVLAAFFGYGVLEYNESIKEVFKRTVDYGALQLQKGRNQAQTVNLNDYDILASLPDGRSLYLWKEASAIHVMVPIYDLKTPTVISVQLRQRSQDALSDLDPEPLSYPIDWSSSELTHDVSNNLLFTKAIDLVLTKKKIDTVNPPDNETVARLKSQGIDPPNVPSIEIRPN